MISYGRVAGMATCRKCGNEFVQVGRGVYCTDDCRAAAVRERDNARHRARWVADEAHRKAKNARRMALFAAQNAQNPNYTPMALRTAARDARGCSAPGCSRQHLARGMCKSHYTKWRRRQGLIPGALYQPDVELGAMTPRGPRRVIAKVMASGGLMVYCPHCHGIAGGTSLTSRYCHFDPTITIELNPDEVAAVVAAARVVLMSLPAELPSATIPKEVPP